MPDGKTTGKSLDSEFDQLLQAEPDADKRRDAQLAVLLVHMRMANAQLAEYAVQAHQVDKRLGEIEVSLAENTTITGEVRELMQSVKGGMKVLGWIGAAGKWLGGLAGAAVAIYTAWYAATHGGDLPGGK